MGMLEMGGLHCFALASIRSHLCVGLLRGHDSDDVFRRYQGSEKAAVDWECGVGVRLGARWRAAVITQTHYPWALQGYRLPMGYFLVRSFICSVIVFYLTNVHYDRRMHLPLHFRCHVCLFPLSSPLR
jgi:hypothetical protein